MGSASDNGSLGRGPLAGRLAIVIMVGLGAIAGCDSPPIAQQHQTFETLQACERSGVPQEAPDLYLAAQSRYDSAWQVIEHETQQWFFLRDFRLADTLLLQAESQAKEAMREATVRRERTLARLGEKVSNLRELLRALRRESESHLMRIRLRQALTLADVRLASAEESLRELQSEAASASVEEAAKVLTQVEQLLGRTPSDSGEQTARWRGWVRETVDWSRKTDSTAFVVVKSNHRGYLLSGGHVAVEFPVELGFRSGTSKRHAGDAATPEGIYRVVRKRLTGSKYYKALDLDYPNTEDRQRFTQEKRLGILPSNLSIGGNIEIHGEGGRGHDWTNGCIALANEDMDRLLAEARVGSRVTIVRHIDGWPQ